MPCWVDASFVSAASSATGLGSTLAGVIRASERRQVLEMKLVEIGIEQAKMNPRAQFVIRSTGWIDKFAIQLTCLHAENQAGVRGVASETILAAWIIPCLRSDTGGSPDENRFGQVGGQKIGVAVVRTPFVSDAVNAPGVVADEKSSFEAAFRAGMGFVDGQFEGFYENSAGGEIPFAGW